MTIRDFGIKVGADGSADVHVDGTPVEVSGLALEAQARETPRLMLTLAGGGGVIEGQGLVEIVREPQAEELLMYAGQWIASLDVEVIRQAVKERMTNLRSDPIATTLQVLVEAAGADRG